MLAFVNWLSAVSIGVPLAIRKIEEHGGPWYYVGMINRKYLRLKFNEGTRRDSNKAELTAASATTRKSVVAARLS